MAKPMTLSVRLDGALSDFVAANVGAGTVYASAGEYVRDLIRREREQAEAATFARLKAELQRAFTAPDENFITWDVETVIGRGRPE